MKTLNKNITKTFFKTEDGYSQLELNWKTSVHAGKHLSTSALLLYMIVRGKDWRKAFTPIRSANKLKSGMLAYGSAISAFNQLKYILKPYRSHQVIDEQYEAEIKKSIATHLPEFNEVLVDNFLEVIRPHLELDDTWPDVVNYYVGENAYNG